MQKGQRSISSFFAPKPAAATPKSSHLPSPKPPAAAKATPHPQSDDLLPSDDEHQLLQLDRPSKRPLNSANEDDAREVLPKKARTSFVPSPERKHAPASELVQKPPPTQESRSRVTERTSKYLFTSAQNEKPAEDQESDEAIKVKERLHQRFVKKLGRPDSIAEIKRRNHFLEDAVPDDEDAVEEDQPDERLQPQATGKGRKGAAGKKSAGKLTPMEKQVLEIKAKHKDTLLVVEVGYKFRFFGEDARTAAKELGIVCIPGKFRYDERGFSKNYLCTHILI